jgi:hypothetical protein
MQLRDVASGGIKFKEKSVSSPFISVPLSLQYGNEGIANLGPLIKLKAEQQKVCRRIL